jgi:hypothetical protein
MPGRAPGSVAGSMGRKAAVPRSRTKPTQAQVFYATFSELVQALELDQQCARAPCTAMTPQDRRVARAVEEVVARRVHALCGELQLLVIACPECPSRLWHAALRLAPLALNRVQSALDVCGAEEITDFLRLHLRTHQPQAQLPLLASAVSASSTTIPPQRPYSTHRGPVCARVPPGSRGRPPTCSGRRQSAGVEAQTVRLRYDAMRRAGHPFIELAEAVHPPVQVRRPADT